MPEFYYAPMKGGKMRNIPFGHSEWEMTQLDGDWMEELNLN